MITIYRYLGVTIQDSSLHVLDKSALYGSSLELFSAVGMAAAGCHAHRRKKPCEAATSKKREDLNSYVSEKICERSINKCLGDLLTNFRVQEKRSGLPPGCVTSGVGRVSLVYGAACLVHTAPLVTVVPRGAWVVFSDAVISNMPC